MKTWEYLERVRAEYGGEKCTPYRLSKLLNVMPVSVYRYQDGKEADDQIAMRIAVLLDLPPMQVIADIHAARAEAEGKADLVKVWSDAAKMFGRAAVVVACIGATTVGAVGGPSGIRTQNQGIMSPLL